MSGRLIKDKGVYEFIEAAKTVKKQYPSTTFTLIGGQDDNPSSLSKDEIDELKKENIIEYFDKTNLFNRFSNCSNIG